MAAERLAALNPEVASSRTACGSSRTTSPTWSTRYDVVVTAVDNFPTRYLLNDACVLAARRSSTAPCCA